MTLDLGKKNYKEIRCQIRSAGKIKLNDYFVLREKIRENDLNFEEEK